VGNFNAGLQPAPWQAIDPGTSPQAEVARAFGPLLWETQRGLGSTQIPCGNDKRDGGSGAVGAGNLG
jgi:hypothetical protein